MVKALKNLSKTTKIVAASSIAGAAVIGTGIGIGLGVSGLTKDKSKATTAYDEFSKTLLPSNSPFYKSWEAAGRSMLSALKKGTTRAIDDAQDYFLIAMSKRPVFKDADSEIKYQYYDQETKQTIVMIADLDVEDASGNKKANVIRCMVNGQEITSNELTNINTILDRETTVSQDREERRQKNIQRLQEIAVDEHAQFNPTIKSVFSKSTTYFLHEQFRKYKNSTKEEREKPYDSPFTSFLNPFEAPDDVDGFTFKVVDVFNPLSSGYIDVLLEIKLKTDEGQPLSRQMVRHIKAVSDAESIDKDGGDFLANYAGTDDERSLDIYFDDQFWNKYGQTLPSKIPVTDIQSSAKFLTPSTGYIVGKIISVDSTDDVAGTITVSVEYSFADKGYSGQTAVMTEELTGFKGTVPVDNDAEIKKYFDNECVEFDQKQILDNLGLYSDGDTILAALQTSSSRDDNGVDANTFFNHFPIQTSQAIDEAHAEELTDEKLIEFGFPPAVTLNKTMFKYTYWVDEVTDSTDNINLNIKITTLNASGQQLSKVANFIVLVDSEGMAKYKQYVGDQEKMATAQGIANKLLHGNVPGKSFEFSIDPSMVDEIQKLLPEDSKNPQNSAFQVTSMEIPLDDDKWAFLKGVDTTDPQHPTPISFRETLLAEFQKENAQNPNIQIDPNQFRYRLLLQNYVATDGVYKVKFVIDYKGDKYVAQPHGDQWKDSHPEPIEIKFTGFDNVLIDRAQKFLQAEIDGIKNDPTNNMPTRYFSYQEINSAAFKDPSSVYFGYTFNPNNIIVPGIKDAQLTQAVIVAFNTRVATNNDPNVAYTYSHGRIEGDGESIYTITLTRGQQTAQVQVPVKVNGFLETKTNVKQFQLELFDKEVIKPNNMVFQMDAFDYELPTGWFTIDKTSDSFGGTTMLDKLAFQTQDPNTRRLFAWLKLYSVVDGLDQNESVEAKIDPKRNPDGTYNVHMRIVGHEVNHVTDDAGRLHLIEEKINWYQEGIKGEVVLKVNVVNREANGLQGRVDKISDLKIDVVSKTGLPPFDKVIRSADEYFSLFSTGLRLFDKNSASSIGAAAAFEFEYYYYEVKMDKPLVPSVNGGVGEVKITAFLKDDPRFFKTFTKQVSIYPDNFTSPDGKTSAEYAAEIQKMIDSKTAWDIHLFNGMTMKSIENDGYNFTILSSSEFEKAMAAHQLPNYGLVTYHQMQVIDTPHGKQLFIRYIYEPSERNVNAEKSPIFTFMVPVNVVEADNALKDYITNFFGSINQVVAGMKTTPIVNGGKYTSSIPIVDELLSGDTQQLNKYLSLSRALGTLKDGYMEATRVLKDHRYSMEVVIYRDSTKQEEMFRFTIEDNISLVGASPLGAPMIEDSSTIYN